METTKVFGFWVYLMTDLVLFAVLFAALLVLRMDLADPSFYRDFFNLPQAFIETVILLASSFSCSLFMLEIFAKKKKKALFWLSITFILGVLFLISEFSEFARLIREGKGPSFSGYLSSFYTLVSTHGLHISIGLLWMIIAGFQIAFRSLGEENISKLFRLALFWHFLDVVWIFIFTLVYGMNYLS